MLVAQLYRTLCNPTDCSPLGSSVHEILQARILEWTAVLFTRGSSRPRDRTRVFHTAGRLFTIREAPVSEGNQTQNTSRRICPCLSSDACYDFKTIYPQHFLTNTSLFLSLFYGETLHLPLYKCFQELGGKQKS